jgi:hypothetical protein
VLLLLLLVVVVVVGLESIIAQQSTFEQAFE